MKRLDAAFLTSVPAGGAVPNAGLPVVALVGRSNVGKSSLINALTGQRVARAGAKPGTTRLVNVYRVATGAHRPRRLVLADLPGYGYARGGAAAQREFAVLTTGFFERTSPLAGVVLVVDVRHPGLAPDLDAWRWVTERACPLVVAVTKIDRISKSARSQAVRAHGEALGVPILAVSTKTGEGVREIWAAITALL